MNETFARIARLTALAAISGRENACFAQLREQTEGLFDEYITTPTGSFAGIIRCGKADAPLLLLDAHIDEIGSYSRRFHLQAPAFAGGRRKQEKNRAA